MQETRFDPWVGKILWRRKWQPTPVFLPGKSHGCRSLVGYSPWGHKGSDTTGRLHFQGAIYISALPTATLANLIYLEIHHVFNSAFFFFLPKNTIQLSIMHCFYISSFYLFFEIQMKIELKVSFMRKPSMGSILIQMPLLLELFNSLLIYHLACVGLPHSTFLFQSIFQGRGTVVTISHPRFSTMSGTC